MQQGWVVLGTFKLRRKLIASKCKPADDFACKPQQGAIYSVNLSPRESVYKDARSILSKVGYRILCGNQFQSFELFFVKRVASKERKEWL